MTITIRDWTLADAGDLAETINNKKIMDNLRDGLPYPYTEADGRWFISSVLEAPKDSLYAWAIDVDGRAVGSITVSRKDNIHSRTAELGYYLGEDWWGKGIVTAAVREVCDRLFVQTDLLRIFAEPFVYNEASCRVLEKSGFQLEGVMRKNAVKNGAVLDMKLYARVKED